MHMIVCACVNVRLSERICDCGCVITSACVCLCIRVLLCIRVCIEGWGEC